MRRKGSKVHLAVDTLGHQLALHVTLANAQERDEVADLAEVVHEATGQTGTVAHVDQGLPDQLRVTRQSSTGLIWRSSSLSRPSLGLSSCPNAGSWTTALPGPRFCRLAKDYE